MSECPSKVSELMKQFVEACSLYNIPCYVAIAVPGASREYICDMVSPDVLGITDKLKENRFPNYVNVGLGFRTVRPQGQVVISPDDNPDTDSMSRKYKERPLKTATPPAAASSDDKSVCPKDKSSSDGD